MLISISLPSRLGEPCWAVNRCGFFSFAGRPSIVESMVINASTLGALGTSDGGNRVILSILPTRTPARRTSEPSRKPFASAKRAFKCSFLAEGIDVSRRV